MYSGYRSGRQNPFQTIFLLLLRLWRCGQGAERLVHHFHRRVPASSWHWEGSHDPSTWTTRATCYGPSTSTTWNLPASGVVFVRWGGTPGQPYVGTGPLSWAHTTARLQSEAERSLADEAGGPLAQLLAVPSDGGGEDGDPLAALKLDIRGARAGKRCLSRRWRPPGARVGARRRNATGRQAGLGRTRRPVWRR